MLRKVISIAKHSISEDTYEIFSNLEGISSRTQTYRKSLTNQNIHFFPKVDTYRIFLKHTTGIENYLNEKINRVNANDSSNVWGGTCCGILQCQLAYSSSMFPVMVCSSSSKPVV